MNLVPYIPDKTLQRYLWLCLGVLFVCNMPAIVMAQESEPKPVVQLESHSAEAESAAEVLLTSSQHSLLPPEVIVQLDSMSTLSRLFEEEGNYQQAYRVESRRHVLRDSLRSLYLSQLIDEYETKVNSQQLEMRRLRLQQQNIQMEVNQMENAHALMVMRAQQDSISMLNAQIELDNVTAEEELAEKNRQVQESELLRRREQQRWGTILLWLLVGLMLVLITVGVVYLSVRARRNKALRLQRIIAREALSQARAADKAQMEFMLQLNDGVEQPAEEICDMSRRLSEADSTWSDDRRAQAMDRISETTARLLARLDEIAKHCDETVSVLVVMALLSLPSATISHAQNNSLGVNDALYAYYKICDSRIQDPIVMSMSDTLFERAARIGDVQAQCLSFDIKVGHSFFTHSLDSIREQNARLYDFVIKTPYLDYVFFGWNRIIIYSLDHQEFALAMQEAHLYQQAAVRLNNKYGIARGYYYIGEVYRLRGMKREAIQQYEAAARYQREHGGESRIQAASYARVGEIYVDEGNYAAAEHTLMLALENLNYRFESVNPTIELFRLYVLKGDLAKAEVQRQKIEALSKENLVIGSRYTKYMASLVRYHLARREYVEALKCAELIADDDPMTLSMAKAAVGYYEEALAALRRAVAASEEQEKSLDVSRLHTFRTEYENQLLERQTDQLRLQQSQLRLEQLQHERELAVQRKRRDSMALNYQLLQQRSILSDRHIREAELSYRQESMLREEQAAEYQHRVLWFVSAILLVVMIFIIIFVWWRRRIALELTREVEATKTATEAARQAAERKLHFLRQVSHEIRTPLNAIVGFNEVLSDPTLCDGLSGTEREDLRVRSREATAAFGRMVRSAVTWCRVESGVYVPQPEIVGIKELVDAVVEAISPKLRPGVEARVTTNDPCLNFRSDARMLKTVLLHLMDNACKFTTIGSITLDYRMRGDRLFLTVSDTGCGVPKEQAEGIFSNFAKLNEFIPGLGLGLSLCRTLVCRLQGAIELDSEYTDGCRFVIALSQMTGQERASFRKSRDENVQDGNDNTSNIGNEI